MPLTFDKEAMAVALWVETNHGEAAPAHVAAQIGRLALANDADGVAMWKKVAACLDAIRKADGRIL